jgi:hypothetical protein
MHDVNGLIDVSTWSGHWPFLHLRYSELTALRGKLQSCGVVKAYVSPIEAILEQDPLRADRELLTASRELDTEFFSPVPVVDLSYGNWTDVVEMAAADERVGMVRVLPTYHLYEFDELTVAPLVEAARQNGLVIAVQVRVEDARGMYPLMQVPDLDIIRAVKTMSAFREQPFLLCNCYQRELGDVLPALENVYVDLASLEVQDVLQVLRDRYGLKHLLFSTHCAFYYPEGNLNKLAYSTVRSEEAAGVGHENARRLFGQ